MTTNNNFSSSNEKYPINNFYVGELCIEDKSKYNIRTVKISKTTSKSPKQILLDNGAIDTKQEFVKTIFSSDSVKPYASTWQQKSHYYKVLTIFYHTSLGYLCLHNGFLYQEITPDFCCNLESLSNLVPKISYNINSKISIKKALSTFNELFNSRILLEELYDDNKYNLENYYSGMLVLYTDFIPQDKQQLPRQYNVPINYVLQKHTPNHHFSAITLKEVNDKSQELGKYKYAYYPCLFLKLPDGNFYNINNFQIYNKNIIRPILTKEPLLGETCILNLTPLADKLNNLSENKISIPKALIKTPKSNFYFKQTEE